MSSLLYAFGRLAFRRRGVVILLWLSVLGLGVAGAATLSKGTNDTFTIPGTESQQAIDRLQQTFPQASGASAQVVAVARTGKIDTPSERASISRVADRLTTVDQVDTVTSPVAGNGALARDALVSADGRAALITAQLKVPADEVTQQTRDAILGIAVEASSGDVTYTAGGGAFNGAAPGLSPTEGIGLVVALVVLTFTFSSLVAAGMPLLTAVTGVVISLTGVLTATSFAAINSTAPLLAVMIGLAVGIDYALFILARHRDQLAAGLEPEDSAGRAVATAGSAVVFAGLTVMIALTGLAVAGIPFLTVMGLSAAFAVVVAVGIALSLLPALLGVLGHRLVPRAPRPRRWRRRRAAPGDRVPAPPRRTGWWLRVVLRRPSVTVVVLLAGLLLAALPATRLTLALPDAGSAAQGTPQRDTYDLLSREFGAGFNGPLLVTGDVVASTDPVTLVNSIADELRKVPGVVDVPLATPNEDGDTMIIQVVPRDGPGAPSTARLVDALRDLRPQIERDHGVVIAVTGSTALAVDVSTQLAHALISFVILVVGVSLVLLAMVFRSVWVPVKAALGFLLSVGAALGGVVAVYQWGWFEGPLHTVFVGPVVSFMPILLLAILFGLAMDYEVFLVSRMREHWINHHDAQTAVRAGFTAASRVVAAAAIIMFSVFAAFVPEGDATLQPIALGLALGVLVDAFVVRMTLVPAVMALLGARAWWWPGWLDRVLPTFDIEGEGVSRQLALTDWPRPDTADGVHAQGLALGDEHSQLLAPIDLDVEPGSLLLVVGGTRMQRSALAHVLTARTPPSAGRLKVAGFVLPQQAIMARRSIAWVRAVDEDDLAAAVRAALAPRRRRRRARPAEVRVLVVENLEHVPSTAARQEALDEVARGCSDLGVAAVVSIAAAEAGTIHAPAAAAYDVLQLRTATAPLGGTL